MTDLPDLTAEDVLLVIDVQNDFCPGRWRGAGDQRAGAAI